MHDIKSNAAAGNLGDLRGGGEPGQKEELEQLLPLHGRGHFTRSQRATHDALTHRLDVDAAAVVADANVQHSSVMSRFNAQHCLRGFALRAPFIGRLDSVVERVAQQMVERRIEARENVAVNRHAFANDLQTRLFAQRTRKVAHRTRQRRGGVGERSHAARKNFVIKLRRSFLAAANGRLDGEEMRDHAFSAFFNDSARARHQSRVEPSSANLRAQTIEFVFETHEHALEIERLLVNHAQSPRFQHGFAGKLQKPIKFFRGHTHA